MKKSSTIYQLFLFIIFSSNYTFSQKSIVQWKTLEQMEIALVKEPRKVMIEVYSKDCEWCKKFEAEVMANSVIANYINSHYYIVKVEAFDKTSIRFKNKELSSTNGFHPLTSEYLKGQVPLSFPTQLFFDENLNFLNFLKGYSTPQNFEMAIAYFGEDYYKTQGWSAFLQSFKGKIK